MHHRPADTRLLSNLLAHEKDYVRSLHSQLEYGQSSLSSFHAYAAASPPPGSRAIGSVANALIGAQDALRGYVLAVEEWCEQLKMLRDMEDEVGTIARDREILVDRLIKASKANNPKRRSLLPSSNSNNLGSPVFSGSNQAIDQLAFSNSKLNLAQSELQACETHLTEKERVLAQMRESCLVGGLKMRCKALAECGVRWSELGRSGLQALDMTSSTSRGSFDRANARKPLPAINYPYQRPSSDISSSIAPSQSASQIFNPDAVSDQCHPSVSSSSGHHHSSHLATRAHGVYAAPPETDIHDDSRFELSLPPAHAISEEDHYIPPQARISPPRVIAEEEEGGSSLEEESDDRQYEVHENPMFASHPLASKPVAKAGSKTRLPLKKPRRLKSESTTALSTSASAPIQLSGVNPRDRFPSSWSGKAYSEGHQELPRPRKRSNILGFSVITGMFHRRDRNVSADRGDSQVPPSPSKKGVWRMRTDKNLKKTGKRDESSDDEGPSVPAAPTREVPSYLLPALESKGKLANAGQGPGDKRSGSGGRKLRKASDAAAQRKALGGPSTGQTIQQQQTDERKPAGANGQSVSHLSSTSVSRSSTVRSESTIKSSMSARAGSLDLPRPSSAGASGAKSKRTTTLSDAGMHGHGRKGPTGNTRRRPTSMTSPPTTGQMSLLSIVEDVTRQNRQGRLQANPNNLLVEVKAPKSVLETLNFDGPSSESAETPRQTNSDVGPEGTKMRRRGGEAPLRQQLAYNDPRRNTLAASSSEPHLPLKELPPTPSPPQKAPLRSALRNRSVSPNPATTTTPPRTSTSPIRAANDAAAAIGERPKAERKDSEMSSEKDDDAASAYETGHEDFDSGPPTPTVGETATPKQQERAAPNGHARATLDVKSIDPHVEESSTSTGTGGTATPPSRRKSVRVSLKPTFSPTPPALTDYDEEDRLSWIPAPPAEGNAKEGDAERSGWVSRKSAESVWDDSSDEDEEYSRARAALSKASHRMEKSLKERHGHGHRAEHVKH